MTDLLREILDCSQVPGEPPRRWFRSSTFDLIIWFGPDGNPVGFQLCYCEGADEKALTWRDHVGFTSNRVDDGESRPGRPKMTPILVPDGSVDASTLLREFREQGTEIDPAIVAFVSRKLEEYADNQGP